MKDTVCFLGVYFVAAWPAMWNGSMAEGARESAAGIKECPVKVLGRQDGQESQWIGEGHRCWGGDWTLIRRRAWAGQGADQQQSRAGPAQCYRRP